MDNPNLLNNDLQVDTEVQRHLNDTAKWAKFLAIIGFIFSGILFLAALVNVVNYSESSSRGYYYSSSSSQTLGPGYTIFSILVIGVVWLVASLYTFRFATKMKTALQGLDQLSFNESLSNLSKNYKFLGVVTIVYLALIVLLIIAGIFFASFGRY